MSSICAEIASGVVKACGLEKPVMGIEQDLVLINEKDLPLAGITFDETNPNELITALELAAGKVGFLVEGLKQIMNYNNSFETPDDAESGVIHTIAGIRVQQNTVEAQKFVNDLINGARVYAVIEMKWKGTDNANAFRFFGIKYALELKEMADASNENDAVKVLTLGTPNGFREPFVPHQLLDTDYDTTKTAFDNKFEAAP